MLKGGKDQRTALAPSSLDGNAPGPNSVTVRSTTFEGTLGLRVFLVPKAMAAINADFYDTQATSSLHSTQARR